MIIGTSTMSLASSRSYASELKEKSTLTIGNEKSISEISSSRKESSSHFTDIIKSEMIDSSSDEMEKSMLGMKSRSSKGIITDRNSLSRENNRKVREQTLLFLIRFLYNKLWRKDNENFDFESYLNQNNSSNPNVIGSTEQYYSYKEEEATEFNTTGKVVTADGREISFDVSMKMSRSFSEKYYSKTNITSQNAARMIDPLVINLDNNAADISDQKFLFDLDQDGILDNISGLGSKSGFIALDLNEDGVINDGSELFGTKSGDGFLDLSKYDEDGNGWIDEADSIFSKLLIWTKDENGKDMLYHLKDKNIGALSLECVSTDFSLKDLKDNVTNAEIRKTGIFLYENGGVGTMQQLDLAT